MTENIDRAELPPGVPEADALEQRASAAPDAPGELSDDAEHLSEGEADRPEAGDVTSNEADRAEQTIDVPDDEEYPRS